MIIIVSALIRGSYHLYQGFGGFVGNLIMGVIFGLIYLRWKRVAPLIVAHTVLDIAGFVGYALVAPHVSWLDLGGRGGVARAGGGGGFPRIRGNSHCTQETS